jgi:hypothetical protein
MATSITNLVTTFEKVLERQNAIEARQAMVERALEDRQKANETAQAEKNRQMELQIAVAHGKSDSQYSLMEKNMGDMAASMAAMCAHMKAGPSGTLPSTTGTPQITQISELTPDQQALLIADMTSDQLMLLANMSGAKRKQADDTNPLDAFDSQVALTDGPLTQEEQSRLGAAAE